MNTQLKLFLFAIVIILFGCKNNTQKVINLRPTKSVDILNDSTFFSSSHCMINQRNMVFIAEESRILVTDEEFNIIRVIGRPGNGPGEFNKIYHFIIYKDSLYAVNEMLKTMNIYRLNGKYIRKFALPASPQGRIAVDDSGRFYLSTNYGEKPIICFDNKGNIIDSFGKMVNEKTESLSRRKTILDLYVNEGTLISLNRSELIIKYYSIKKRTLSNKEKINLTRLNDFNTELKYKEKILSERFNASVSVISDAYLDGNYLYFSIVERNDNGPYINKFVKLNLMNIQQIKIFEIENEKQKNTEHWITSLCAQHDTLYVSDADTKSLLKYVIK